MTIQELQGQAHRLQLYAIWTLKEDKQSNADICWFTLCSRRKIRRAWRWYIHHNTPKQSGS